MHKEYIIKLGVSLVAAIVGANLLFSASASPETLWLLLPGVLLFIVGAPGCYYYFARVKSSYGRQTHDDIVQQAKRDAGIERSDNDQKI